MGDDHKTKAELRAELEALRRRLEPASPTGTCDACINVSGRHNTLLLAVIEGTTDAVFIKDTQGRYMLCNSSAARILGRPAKQILGRDDLELLPGPTARQIIEHDRRVLTSGDPHTYEVTIPVRNAPRVFQSTKTAYRGPDGEIVGLIGISRDITKRKRAERALRESEERLERIVESAMDAIITIDDERIIRLFNAAAEGVFRTTAGAALGRSIDRFVSPALQQLLDRCYKEFERSDAQRRYLWAPQGITAVRADGEEFPVEATISRADAVGQKLYTLILRDVNERDRAEDEVRRLQLQNVYLQHEVGLDHTAAEIVGLCPGISDVLQKVDQVAGTDSTVMITGETGTGKELVARAIHNASRRCREMLVKVNCPALPSGLIESELFGHEKGAFTGALSRKIGRFELADGGTIFLDEIGDLPLELQAKLLRVLQEGEFERIGGTETFHVDVRVIAATNRDLEEAIADQRFRPDLYYRLNVFPLRVPPLRERTDDIPLLVRHFVMKYAAKMGKRIQSIPDAAMLALKAYAWPGNVRELQNVVERAVILTPGTQLRLGEWPPQAAAAGAGERPMTLADVERQHIIDVLELTGWRVSGERGAARILGMKPTTLEARMKKLDITRAS